MPSPKLVVDIGSFKFAVCFARSRTRVEPIVSVQVTPVKQGLIEKVLLLKRCCFTPASLAHSENKRAGEAFYVNRGSKVKAGQLLAT